MKTNRKWLIAAGTLLMSVSAFAQVDVRIQLLKDQQLKVSYQLPPSCSSISFLQKDAGAQQFRARWLPQNDCFKLEHSQLSAHQTQCNTAEFIVPTSTDPVAGYPSAYPIGSGIYLHSANYELAATCGTLQYHFEAPFIALRGQLDRHSRRYTPQDDTSFASFLSPDNLQVDQGAIRYIAPNLSKESRELIQAVSSGTINQLRQQLPKAAFSMPIIVAANVKGAGGVRVDGDAADVLRLGLVNWPEVMNADNKTLLTTFVAHELSHRFQLRDAVSIYPQARLIHEGGAEFLRWMTALQLQWTTPEEAALDLDKALGLCFLGTDNAAWATIPKSKLAQLRLPYTCGLAVYAYGLAARQSKESAMQHIDYFYQQIKQQTLPDFADAIECGRKLDCHPRYIPKLLGGEHAMQRVWSELFQQTGLARASAPNQEQTDTMMEEAFSQIMKQDCGTSSYYGASDGLIIDNIKSCTHLKAGTKIHQVEGLPLFGHAFALQTLIEACETKGNANWSSTNGQEFTLACKHPYQPIKSFYAVNMSKLMRALK